MFVVGRVLDPARQAGAGRNRDRLRPHQAVGESPGSKDNTQAVIGHADADGSGRFRLDAPRTSSTRNDEFMAIALAPGYGSRLGRDRPRRRSARRRHIAAPRASDPGPAIRPARPASAGRRRFPSPQSGASSFRSHRVSDLPPAHLDGPSYWWARVNDFPAWPKPATTDADGRFEAARRRPSPRGSAQHHRPAICSPDDRRRDRRRPGREIRHRWLCNPPRFSPAA